MTLLISDIVDHNALWHGDQPALIEGSRVLTWKDFQKDSTRLRMGLARLGVVRGSRVAVLARNSSRYVLLHYALAGAGAVIVPINIRLRAPEVAYVLSNCQPLLLVAGAEFAGVVEAATHNLDPPPKLILSGSDERSGWDTWEELLAMTTAGAQISHPKSWDDAHMILYTSGTTGRPKGAILSHRRTVLDGLSATGVFGVRPRERFLCHLPLFHTAAWDFTKQYFLRGGAAIMMDRFDPVTAVNLIEEYDCNATWAVPLVLREVIESDRFGSSDMSSMRLVAYATYDPTHLMHRVVAAFNERGARGLEIAHGYGLTEGGPFVSVLPPSLAPPRVDSVGLPLPGVNVNLLDGALKPVARGAPGEICVRSPALMTGYLNAPEATAQAFEGGWLHTGDVGRLDDEGFLYIVDRKKDMVRTGGENVYAKEVEQTIIAHPEVLDCAVIGVPDPVYDERVVGIVVAQPGSAVSRDEIIEHVRVRIASYKAPKEVRFVEALPKTAAGKTAKNELRRVWPEIGSPEPHAEAPRDRSGPQRLANNLE